MNNGQRLCVFCGDVEPEADMHLCAGCKRLGCWDCVEWRAPEDDFDYGEYFCDECQDENEAAGDR